MRKSNAEAAQTRKRIVEEAANEVRRRGVTDANVGDIMEASGLTHGGFYRHFQNRDQLMAEGVGHAVEAVGRLLAERIAQGGPAYAAAEYLSPERRDAEIPNCPYASIGAEMARKEQLKPIASSGLSVMIDTLTEGFDGVADARDRAILLLSTMVGALTLSRLAVPSALSDRILELAREQAVRLAQL